MRKLSPAERGTLASFRESEAFKTLDVVMQDVVQKFLDALTTTSPHEREKIVTNQNLYMAAAAFRQEFLDRINSEVNALSNPTAENEDYFA